MYTALNSIITTDDHAGHQHLDSFN